MKSIKNLNKLQNQGRLPTITLDDETMQRLRRTILTAFLDVQRVCNKYGWPIFLCYGSALGAVRHQGFIPWDDDLDAGMFREDYEELKKVFSQELGEKYELNAPNYSEFPSHRFPQVLVKGTKFVELGTDPHSESAKVKFDLFIFDNTPANKFIYYTKGLYCNFLMAASGCVNSFAIYKRERQNGLNSKLDLRAAIGSVFSFRDEYSWRNKVDNAIRYDKITGKVHCAVGTPLYFASVRERSVFVPVRECIFEGEKASIPSKAEEYCREAYGETYMQLPPEEKRERHFIVSVKV